VVTPGARRGRRRGRLPLALCAALLGAAGCHKDMYDQPKYRPLEESGFFKNGNSSRPLEPGTVPHGRFQPDDLLTTGKIGGVDANVFPFPVTEPVLRRGQERFNIFCSPCHGRLADGNGMIVQRGFKRPPSFHSDRLRQAPAGHFFDVMTNGFQAMFSYRDRVSPQDRWAIIAYIRALQLSQHASTSDVPPEDLARLEAAER
jgi:mono/diheme cytochrome c family protein